MCSVVVNHFNKNIPHTVYLQMDRLFLKIIFFMEKYSLYLGHTCYTCKKKISNRSGRVNFNL